MSTASRAALRRKVRSKRANRNNQLFYATIGTVVALFAVAVVLTAGGDDPSARSGLRETASVTISGESLPSFTDRGDDPAVGMAMPAISRVDFSGRAASIPDDGRAKVVMYLAHWCSHCQAEVPVVQELIDNGSLPHGVDVYSIATATDRSQPNYPPSAWLKREGWTSPVIVDDASSSAGNAAGVTSYPFFVFVNEDGKVAARMVGELSPEILESAMADLLEH
jgi:cytochrome c biogenesis protein CcmG/thiol:disulfide interchange protein DsbE